MHRVRIGERIARTAFVLSLLVAIPLHAATPSSGTLTEATPTLTYTVGPFAQSNPTPVPNQDDGPRCNMVSACDSYALTVTLPAGYLDDNPNAKIRISTSWAAISPSDYDLHVYNGTVGDLDGSLAADAGSSPTAANPEVVELVPVQGATTTYTIKVVPYAVTPAEAVTGTIELLPDAPDACDGVLPRPVNGAARVDRTMIATLLALPEASRYGAYVHFTQAAMPQRASILSAVGLSIAYDFAAHSSAVFAAGPVSGFRALLANPDVLAIKPNRAITPLGETAGWASRLRVAQEAVSGGPYRDANGALLTGDGVTVVVIDTGLNATHPDFAGRVLRNYKLTGDPILNPETVQAVDMGPNSDTDTTSGHGTHVTGIVAASGVASTGAYPVAAVAPNIRGTFAGAAPDANLIVYSVGEAPDPGLLGVGTLIYVDAALTHTLQIYDDIDPAIRAVSLSLGDGPGAVYNPVDVSSCAVKGLVKKGTNVVFAASNDDGNGTADRTSSFCKDPTPGVICVSSYDDGGTGRRNGALSDFSSRGRIGEPNTYPDVAAPGSAITSTCVQPLPGQTTCATGAETRWQPFYGTISGTSMATPHVSGAIALLAQARPGLTPAQIEDVIQDSALKVSTNGAYEPDPQNTGGTHNFGFGAGLLDMRAVLDALGVAHPGLPVGGSETILIDGDADAAIAGAADVVKLTVQEERVAGQAGLRYRMTLRDALDFAGVAGGLEYRIVQFIDGESYTRAIAATVDSIESGVVRENDVVSFFVPYADVLFPQEGAPVHNVRVEVLDVAAGALLDAAPSPADSTGESAALQPMYGLPFTVLDPAPLPPPVFENTCIAPGITLFNDANGDDAPPLPTAANGSGDILSLNVAEPENEPTKLVFTLKMRSLAALPPNVNWYVIFFGPAKGTNVTGKWHVEMETSESSVAAFGYGRYSPANQNLSNGPDTADGDETSAVAMAGSGYDAATGTITLKVNKSNFGPAGIQLTGINAVVYQLVGAAGTGSLQIVDQGSGLSNYRVRLPSYCPNTIPVPTLAGTPLAGSAPLAVSLTASATDPDGDTIAEYHFDFGDGMTVNQTTAQAVHLYDADGTFAPTVRVRDSRGLLSAPSVPLSVSVVGPNAAPIAALIATPRYGAVPMDVTFDASGSSDPDSGDDVESFTLNFGDGSPPVTQSTPIFMHTYTSAGTHVAQLNVTDSRGLGSASAASTSVVVVIDPVFGDGFE